MPLFGRQDLHSHSVERKKWWGEQMEDKGAVRKVVICAVEKYIQYCTERG